MGMSIYGVSTVQVRAHTQRDIQPRIDTDTYTHMQTHTHVHTNTCTHRGSYIDVHINTTHIRAVR